MKTSLLKKGAGAAIALCAAAATVSLAPAAQAVPYANANDVVVTAGGSDTTQNFMTQYLAGYNGNTTVLPGKTLHTYNIPSFPGAPFVTFGDKDCIQDVSWTQNTTANLANQKAPAGSGAGLDYLWAEAAGAANQRGCIDIARSSGGPGLPTANGGVRYRASQEFYAFAMDAVTWASPSLKAPGTLTRQQVQDIYRCQITNWDQVGGTSGQIQRYLPQSTSGTRSFFTGEYGITAAHLAIVQNNPALPNYCPPVKDNFVDNPDGGADIPMEENQGTTIEGPDIDKAILPYSAGVWSYQAVNKTNPTLDKRNGVRLGGLTTVTGAFKGSPVEWQPSDRKYQLSGTTVNETNIKQANPALTTSDYVGVRYVYNVVDNTGGIDGYEAGVALIGFDNIGGGTKSDLCSNDGFTDGQATANALIVDGGFKLLNSSGNPLGSNAAGATCRFFTNPV